MTPGGVQFRWMGELAVVTMPAEIDAVNAAAVRQALLAQAGHDAAVLILDMSGTLFCDSAGIQIIIEAYRRATAARTGLRLVATEVLRVLTLVGVDRIIPIYPTLDAALAGAPRG
jgi:anti-anti-sigma factor